MYLSIVIPLYNEADNVEPLYEGLQSALDPRFAAYEVIFIDDGSRDETLPRLRSLVQRDARIRAVQLRRNFGQTAALRAGIEHARGSIIVAMDGDLQNDPRDIPALVDKIEEGYDLVTGWRRDRQDPAWSRNLPSKIANRLIARVSQVPIHDTGCSLKAYRAELIRRVPLYSELHRFIPAMSSLASVRFAEVVVRHHPRRFGQSKYGLSRVGRVVLDLLTVGMLLSSAQRPLHWFGSWAMPCFLLAALTALAEAMLQWHNPAATSIVLPVVAFLFGSLGVHLVIMGMLGELVVRTEPEGRVTPLRQCLDYPNPTATASDVA